MNFKEAIRRAQGHRQNKLPIFLKQLFALKIELEHS